MGTRQNGTPLAPFHLVVVLEYGVLLTYRLRFLIPRFRKMGSLVEARVDLLGSCERYNQDS
jgi:hypothetical protein